MSETGETGGAGNVPPPNAASNNADPTAQLQAMQKLIETQLQMMQMQITNNGMAVPANVKNVKCPEGRYDMNANDFRTFSKDCRDYKKLTNYSDAQIVLQIRMNMDADLKRAIDINYKDDWDSYTVEDAIKGIGALLKVKNTPVVHRKEFDGIKQHQGEAFKEFLNRLKICAEDCSFVCPFDATHDLTEFQIINRIRSGIYDQMLQQELLQKSDSLNTLALIKAHCENYESAKADQEKLSSQATVAAVEDELSDAEVAAAISAYKRKQKNSGQNRQPEQPSDQKCENCGYDWPHAGGKNACPAKGKTCKFCKRLNHFSSVCKQRKGISALVIGAILRLNAMSVQQKNALPRLDVFVGIDNEAPTKLEVVADTGAQASVGGPQHMAQLGIQMKDLRQPAHGLQHAGGKTLQVLGSYPIYVVHNDKLVEDEIYFVKGVKNLYISLQTCKGICIIHKNFPHVNVNQLSANAITDLGQGTSTKTTVENSSTDKLGRVIPNRPEQLPFPPTEENIDKLEKYFLDTFSESTFNNHDPIPHLPKPMKIHVKDDATPHADYTPLPTPPHFRNEIKEQLKAYVNNGILRKVPVGEANEWCAKMVAVKKKDGKPRITVDYQKLNEQCKREAYHSPRPFDVVSNIPKHTYKTVLDAYSGYHQVLLDDKSIKLTTFITDIDGRYQYLRAPQGFKGSGDGFNQRFDDILVDVERKGKVVDDSILWDDSIKDAFYHTFNFLTLCANNGVTLKPEKFKFARKEADFCGYTVGWENFRPSDDTLSAIQNFPMPDQPTITDIRSWFGLVNQLAPFLATTSMMTPFRDLLKSKDLTGRKVYWDDELKQTFNKTKSALCEVAANGLSFYDMKKPTALVTDWSKLGIGFVLLQKHCHCEGEINPLCCTTGWKLVLCNSRHLVNGESDYAPIEGEALGVAWALKKARMFLLGCPSFTIFVDHAPLLKILGDKSLAEIENTRLLNLKMKTMGYNFKIKHIKGLKNHANVFSRYPANQPENDDIKEADQINTITISAISNSTKSALSVTLDALREESEKDEQYIKLKEKLQNGSFAPTASLEEYQIKEFFNVRDRLTIVDDLIMYAFEGKDLRVVIPKNLRHQMVLNLHAANQGETSMLGRARQIMYWPGMDRDVKIHCERCSDCRENAPSLPKEPFIPTEAPDYPFQQVVSDLFEINGSHYLVYIDRLTAFAELAHYTAAPSSSHIITTFREFFHRWGVSEEISLDGGPNLDSAETTKWLESWGTNIRQSSAYYPQSNGRAEAGVKSLKHLLRGNTGHKGSINTDSVARALLQYRNTPLRGVGKSPAELALGRPLRDTIPLPRERYKVSDQWANHLRNRERTMTSSNESIKSKYDEHSRELKPLVVGDKVRCQNVRSKKWDRTGVVVESNEHRQFIIKMDGSGRLSKRNRRHLQKMVIPDIPHILPQMRNSTIAKPTTPLHANVPASSPIPTATSTAQTMPHPVEKRSSNRQKKTPKRFHEEFGY